MALSGLLTPGRGADCSVFRGVVFLGWGCGWSVFLLGCHVAVPCRGVLVQVVAVLVAALVWVVARPR